MNKDLVLLDGAVGTSLWEKAEDKVPVWRYNVEKPEIVSELIKEYYDAGSKIILANTFSANGPSVAESGYTVEQIISSAMDIAHDALDGTDAKIALSVGPLTGLLKPFGNISDAEAEEIFTEQIEVGVKGKPDVIFLQTFMDLKMMQIAAKIARKHDIPLFCSFSFVKSAPGKGARTMMGNSIDKILDVDHKADIAKAEAFLRPLLGKKLVGVCRGNEYSPNCIDNDAAIMNAVRANLETLGAEVEMCNEKEFCQKADVVEAALQRAADNGTIKDTAGVMDAGVDAFFSMARSQYALDALDRIEDNGKVVVNSGRGVRRCVRRTMTEMLIEGGVACPDSKIIEKGGEMPTDIDYPCWLKRGDGCAQQKEDTCYVQSAVEAEELLDSFWQRGVTSVVVNEHLCGDLIKFYGVEGTDFFYWFYPSKCGHRSKFGLEVINGDARGIAFDTELLKREADKAALMLGVPVYGGDCVVGDDGALKIIDFNDWPSFAPCRDEAAFHIAMAILKKI